MTSVAPRIFVSYVIRDVVLARLLMHICEENGVECFFAERDLSTGRQFDSELSKEFGSQTSSLYFGAPTQHYLHGLTRR